MFSFLFFLYLVSRLHTISRETGEKIKRLKKDKVFFLKHAVGHDVCVSWRLIKVLIPFFFKLFVTFMNSAAYFEKFNSLRYRPQTILFHFN